MVALNNPSCLTCDDVEVVVDAASLRCASRVIASVLSAKKVKWQPGHGMTYVY